VVALAWLEKPALVRWPDGIAGPTRFPLDASGTVEQALVAGALAVAVVAVIGLHLSCTRGAPGRHAAAGTAGSAAVVA
jgi:hypothetical protein